jgi:hypothetical protein
MVTVRPLDEKGAWQYKSEKEYLCVRNGEEKGFTAAEFKAAQLEGWEKQYQYWEGKKKAYMPPSAAQEKGLERASKIPKSTRFGRQNPISARWNSEEQLVLWRAAWAEVTNRYLEKVGIDARVDHRSHAERGILEQPTIHEGVTARALEQQGFVADRCELNRQIKADNKLLRELRSIYEKIAKAIQGTVPALAEAMEALRRNMLILRYQILHIAAERWYTKNTLKKVQPVLERYSEVVEAIKDTSRVRKNKLEEKKSTSGLNLLKQRELIRQIGKLTEDLEELCSEKAQILSGLQKQNDGGINEVKQWMRSAERFLQQLNEREAKYQGELDGALAQFRKLAGEVENKDKAELYDQRQDLRNAFTQQARQKLQEAYGQCYSVRTMTEVEQDVEDLLWKEEARLKPQAEKQQVSRQSQTERRRSKQNRER